MVNISICTPMQEYQSELMLLLNEYCEKRAEISILLNYYSSIEELRTAHCETNRFQIFIMDMDMEERGGLRYLRELQAMETGAGLVGITSNPLLFKKLKPSSEVLYFMEPVEKNELFAKLDLTMLSMGKKELQYYVINGPDGKRRVAYAEIVYVERYDRCLQFHLADGTLWKTRKLREAVDKKIETIMEDPRFIRTHSSFVVNLSKVVRLEKNEAYMQDGSHVPISARRHREVKRAFEETCEKDIVCINQNQAEKFVMRHPELSAFERIPLGMAVMRVDVDGRGEPSDFVFVYVNRALCRLEGISREKTLGVSYYTVFEHSDRKWLQEYWETAYMGKRNSFVVYNAEIDKNIRVMTYQPWYGYCACILEDVEEIRDLTATTFDTITSDLSHTLVE